MDNLVNGNSEAQLSPVAPPEYLVQIFGEDTQPLIGIKPDGTVVIHKMGSEVEAARNFYGVLETYGKTLFQQIADLKDELESVNLTMAAVLLAAGGKVEVPAEVVKRLEKRHTTSVEEHKDGRLICSTVPENEAGTVQ